MLLLSACSSGGGEDENNDAGPGPDDGGGNGGGSANTAPVANAGTDHTADPDVTITLVGSGSDADGDSLTYQWSVSTAPAGATYSLQNADAATATFSASTPGSYEAQLTVSDGQDSSAPDPVAITINDVQPSATARPHPNRFSYANVSFTDDFAENGPANAPGDTTWSVVENSRMDVRESNGRLVFDSSGDSSDIGAIQSPLHERYNFFTQPLSLSLAGLQFRGTATNQQQKLVRPVLASTADAADNSSDALLLTLTGNGALTLAWKTDRPGAAMPADNVLVDTAGGFTPTDLEVNLDQSSFTIAVTRANGTRVHFSGYHGIPADQWGARGDSALRIEALRDIAAANGNNATVELDDVSIRSLPLYDAFENGFDVDSGGRRDTWRVATTAASAIVEQDGRLEMSASGSGSTPRAQVSSPLSGHLNFFSQRLAVAGRLAFGAGTAPLPDVRARVALMSADSNAYAAEDALVLEATGGGALRLWAKKNAPSSGQAANATLVNDTLPAAVQGYRLILDKTRYELRVEWDGGSRNFSGPHNLKFYDWGINGDASIALSGERIAGSGEALVDWHEVQAYHDQEAFVAPTVYGPGWRWYPARAATAAGGTVVCQAGRTGRYCFPVQRRSDRQRGRDNCDSQCRSRRASEPVGGVFSARHLQSVRHDFLQTGPLQANHQRSDRPP